MLKTIQESLYLYDKMYYVYECVVMSCDREDNLRHFIVVLKHTHTRTTNQILNPHYLLFFQRLLLTLQDIVNNTSNLKKETVFVILVSLRNICIFNNKYYILSMYMCIHLLPLQFSLLFVNKQNTRVVRRRLFLYLWRFTIASLSCSS